MTLAIIPHASPNFGARRNGIKAPDMLILHSMNIDLDTSLSLLCDPKNEWSAHYLISEDGRIFNLVEEQQRAWHAGISYWRGEQDINSHSLGIELVHPHLDGNNAPYASPQITSLIALCRELMRRYKIARHMVLAHGDIAPLRKTDPDYPFVWKELAAHGIGIWTQDFAPLEADDDLKVVLQKIGYDTTGLSETLRAFKHHFIHPDEEPLSDSQILARAKAVEKLFNQL